MLFNRNATDYPEYVKRKLYGDRNKASFYRAQVNKLKEEGRGGHLLRKKLDGIHSSSRNVRNMRWRKQVCRCPLPHRALVRSLEACRWPSDSPCGSHVRRCCTSGRVRTATLSSLSASTMRYRRRCAPARCCSSQGSRLAASGYGDGHVRSA